MLPIFLVYPLPDDFEPLAAVLGRDESHAQEASNLISAVSRRMAGDSTPWEFFCEVGRELHAASGVSWMMLVRRLHAYAFHPGTHFPILALLAYARQELALTGDGTRRVSDSLADLTEATLFKAIEEIRRFADSHPRMHRLHDSFERLCAFETEPVKAWSHEIQTEVVQSYEVCSLRTRFVPAQLDCKPMMDAIERCCGGRKPTGLPPWLFLGRERAERDNDALDIVVRGAAQCSLRLDPECARATAEWLTDQGRAIMHVPADRLDLVLEGLAIQRASAGKRTLDAAAICMAVEGWQRSTVKLLRPVIATRMRIPCVGLPTPQQREQISQWIALAMIARGSDGASGDLDVLSQHLRQLAKRLYTPFGGVAPEPWQSALGILNAVDTALWVRHARGLTPGQARCAAPKIDSEATRELLAISRRLDGPFAVARQRKNLESQQARGRSSRSTTAQANTESRKGAPDDPGEMRPMRPDPRVVHALAFLSSRAISIEGEYEWSSSEEKRNSEETR